jgi:aspartyl-tRNA(Asn)/glutamyl-tRNA(Gln) amidotransferase subunit A
VSHPTLAQLAEQLSQGETSSRKLVEQSLERIADSMGEGARTFISVDAEAARLSADYQDQMRKAGRAASRYAGIPFSVKDLFDVVGQVTTAGSLVLRDEPAAQSDAPAIAALKGYGLVPIGRTNMTEFAYSGLGLNPHYGTPRSVFERKVGRAPGGSSSGAAIAVADGMCALSIGSDTGGSCRIPAAYNGVFGYKPSASRISKKGAYPLSSSFDSIGSFGHSVACCATADAIMAGDWDGEIASGPSRPLRIGVLKTVVQDSLDPEVAGDFERSVSKFKAAGLLVEDVHFDGLNALPQMFKRGGIAGAEAYAFHSNQLVQAADQYDPRVAGRIQSAAQTTAADYIKLLHLREQLIGEFKRLASGYDAIVMPTVANIAPILSDLQSEEAYTKLNGLALRNTYIANIVDGCAISLPMHEVGMAPTGLMLMAPWGADQSLFSAANSISSFI